jgi:hypothetical protein
MSLDFHSLCTVASFLKRNDFINVVSACKAWSECRHDVRTVAQVYVNTRGDEAPLSAAEFGRPVVRFFARQFPERLHELALRSLECCTAEPPALIVPLFPADKVIDLAIDAVIAGPNQLAAFLKHWKISDDLKEDLAGVVLYPDAYDIDIGGNSQRTSEC